VEADDLPLGAGNRGAGGDGNTLPDRAASQRKMIMRRDVGREAMNAAACRRAFVGHDNAARQMMGNHLSGRDRIERAARNIGLARFADT
jgi:hypothetical protein